MEAVEGEGRRQAVLLRDERLADPSTWRQLQTTCIINVPRWTQRALYETVSTTLRERVQELRKGPSSQQEPGPHSPESGWLETPVAGARRVWTRCRVSMAATIRPQAPPLLFSILIHSPSPTVRSGYTFPHLRLLSPSKLVSRA